MIKKPTGITTIEKNSDKEMYVHIGYRITFDCAGWWSFNDDSNSLNNVIFFGVDNNSTFHAGNCKNNFLGLRRGPIFYANGSFGSPEKKGYYSFW